MKLEFPLIEVKGTAYEMGRQHGEQAGDLVRKYLLLIERLAGKPRDILCRNAERFLEVIERLSPKYVEEVRGLAEGARISFAEAQLCQVRTQALYGGEAGCTAFALRGEATLDGLILIGQNQEFEPEFAEVATLLRVCPTDGRPRALMITFAGQLGYSGINEFGVAHFANSLFNCNLRLGVPPYPMKRAMLEQRSVAEAIALLERHNASTAGNVVLADGQGEIADVEFRPEGTAIYRDEHPDMRLHSNHYVAPEFAAFEDNTVADSPARLCRMRTLLKKSWGRITVDVLKEVLADHEGDPAGICRHGASNWHTVFGYIAEPARRLFHLRRGHGCLGTWGTYTV
jgi:predicted choloylglycine hydrolase